LFLRTSIFLLFTLPIFSTNIIFSNIKEEIYRNNKFQYRIQAQKKVEKFKKDTKVLFFNRKKYVSENFYYEYGSVVNSRYNIKFKRMFIYGQNIYMQEVKGSFFKYTFKAKSVVVYRDRMVFSHIFFKSAHKKGSKLKFIYYFNKKNEII